MTQSRLDRLTERLRERLKAAGVRTHVEGAAQGDWVLVDAGDAIVQELPVAINESPQYGNAETQIGGGC